MPNNFELASFLIADFVSQDTQGRWNFIGVYTNGLAYSQFIPDFFPALNIILVTIPKQKDFTISIKITSPNGIVVFENTSEINGNIIPPAEARFLWVHKLPDNVPLDGSGNYTIEISDGDESGRVSHLLPIVTRTDTNVSPEGG